MRVAIIVVLYSQSLAHSRCSNILVKCENMVSTPSTVVLESLKCTPVVESLGLQTNQRRRVRPTSLAHWLLRGACPGHHLCVPE